MRLIGVDVGGTFTDIVFTDTDVNRTLTHKVASTPDDPARAFMRGVSEICDTAGVGLGGDRPHLPRHDGRDQRGAAVSRRARRG